MALSYIDAKNTLILEDEVQVGSHCSIYSMSTIDGKRARSFEEGVARRRPDDHHARRDGRRRSGR